VLGSEAIGDKRKTWSLTLRRYLNIDSDILDKKGCIKEMQDVL
jgi:hypothetical protein